MSDDAAEMYRSLIHTPPGVDRVAALETLIAAAEERGRRSGVEEAIRKAEAYFKLHTSQPQDLIRALHAALAPRDSGKEPE